MTELVLEDEMNLHNRLTVGDLFNAEGRLSFEVKGMKSTGAITLNRDQVADLRAWLEIAQGIPDPPYEE